MGTYQWPLGKQGPRSHVHILHFKSVYCHDVNLSAACDKKTRESKTRDPRSSSDPNCYFFIIYFVFENRTVIFWQWLKLRKMPDKTVPLVYSGPAPPAGSAGVIHIDPGISEISFVNKYLLKDLFINKRFYVSYKQMAWLGSWVQVVLFGWIQGLVNKSPINIHKNQTKILQSCPVL